MRIQRHARRRRFAHTYVVVLISVVVGVLLLGGDAVLAQTTPDGNGGLAVADELAASGSGSALDEDVVVATPTPTPSPTFASDDCSPCCDAGSAETHGTELSDAMPLACCQVDQSRDLFSTRYGECSGLPCCHYNGRPAQPRQAWYPCLLFPTCQNDPTKQEYCRTNAAVWSFLGGATFDCADGCCFGPVLESNVWTGVVNAMPGQVDATFALSFKPTDFMDVFYPSGTDFTLQQIVIASPPEYEFGVSPSCRLSKTMATAKTSVAGGDEAMCAVMKFNGTTHLTVDIPTEYRGKDEFTLTFDRVITPSGVITNTTTNTSMPDTPYSTRSNLVPVYFQFNDTQNGYVFNTFYRTSSLEPASLTSGSFVPENIYPGNSGNATLVFFSNARIPKGSVIDMTFGERWVFNSVALWSWQTFPASMLDLIQLNATSVEMENEADDRSSRSADGSSNDIVGANATKVLVPSFRSAKFVAASNQWLITVEEDLAVGWISLGVNEVQNPAVAYTGLNLARMAIRDPRKRLILQGTFSAISVEMLSDPIASPYNYVTLVVLIGTLFFCSVVIRSNGLSFSFGSIWTDLTAICTVLASITAIVNNLMWAMVRSSSYFYISRIFLCFTFTMLTAVCFHWGTVLSLRLRKLPHLKTVVAFVVINLLFYFFQAALLFYHQDLISRVYASENDSQSFANQQCKTQDEDALSNNVFSEIQGYLWSCYAHNDEQFFLVSTTVTSAVFLGLTVVVMALGFMVMRRGKLLLGSATGPHQVVLVKALRLYYTLIGVVTMVYLLAWVVQIASRSSQAISYPWFYIFTVWLPYSIPPCCLIFLQWNSATRSLKDADYDPTLTSPLSQADMYDEIRTPSFAFSTSERWSDDFDDFDEEKDRVDFDYPPYSHLAPATTLATVTADDFIGLSMSLETNEDFPMGCFVAIQRLSVDPLTQASAWRQISNTDTVEVSRKDTGSVSSGRHVYSFMAVPRIPVSSMDDKVRLVVYAVNPSQHGASRTDHHSEMTAESVLAALDTRSSGDDDQSQMMSQTSTCDDSVDFQTTRMIDELFEDESEPDSTEGAGNLMTTLSIVAEFTVSTDALVNAGARSEQVVLIAAEHSYKQFGLELMPPKLSVHTVLPKAARTKYGLAGIATGLTSSHSMSSQYHIREQGLLVVEDLTESRFSNSIPRQILEAIIRHRSKQFLMAQNDLARLEGFDRQRQKGSDRGIYENLIQQIQDDGDINRCREWMIQRCQYMKEYIDLLRRLRRSYLARDHRREYFKPSTEKKNSHLRFLPINLHLQEMWVGSASESVNGEESSACVYDIVTVGAMAAHVYKFKNGGILGLEEQRAKMKSRRREPFGSVASHRQSPLWTEEEQKADNADWEIQKRMDVCFPQAVAALVTAFTRKVDLALQNAQVDQGHDMLDHLEKLGFLFNVESLVSTHGNEAGMLEDMAGAVNELANIRFVLVDETEKKAKTREVSLSFDVDEEMKEDDEDSDDGESPQSSLGLKGSLAGVVDVNIFQSVEDALADEDNKRGVGMTVMQPPSPAHSVTTSSSSFTNMGQRLLSTFIRAKSGTLLSATRPKKPTPADVQDGLFGYTGLVIRVKVRSTRVKLPSSLTYGGTINVTPVLFTQGINEKQTLANNTGSSVTRLQDVINQNSLRQLRLYADRYCNYANTVRLRSNSQGSKSIPITRDDLSQTLSRVEKLIALQRQTRKKRPEILQLTSDLCRRIGAGRVTVCKSAKDRTGMSVTLEQGRILVQNHGLPPAKKDGIVSVMRSEGVRIENALKNTGRRVFAFNALQRSLLPEEYRCPPQTAGKNVS